MDSTGGENTNRGFSLVETIVVIAIMAILIGVLAPAYLRYVEKARKQKDDTAAEEIRHAAEIVVFTGEYVVPEGLDNPVVVTFDKTNGIAIQNDPTGADLTKKLTEMFGELSQVKPESKTYNSKVYVVSIVAPTTPNGVPTMSGAWQ